MNSFLDLHRMTHWMPVALVAALAACGGSDAAGVDVGPGTPNTVSTWNQVASATINQPNATTGTAEERQAIYAFDLATVHIAMHDAVLAIAGGAAPLVARPSAPAAGASQEAAASAAAYAVLSALFPARSASYQAAYDTALAAVTDADAKARGVALGTEVAAAVVAARANDGRTQALAPFVGGSGPGQYRGPGLVGRSYPFVKPFVLGSASALRPPAPPALDSAVYTADVAETAALGGTASTARSEAQALSARFHTEAPPAFWTRNLRPFLMTPRPLADQARLGALLWVAHADATIACFEAKYHYLYWRPSSAITLADTDGNAATAPDPAWASYLPTPPHPEYPAAHGCVAGATAESLRRFFGTGQVAFDFTSTASGTTRHYETIDDMLGDITIARIAGGMHFRNSARVGEALGAGVAAQVAAKLLPH